MSPDPAATVPAPRTRGVTLIELLVVMTIAGLIVGVSFPAVSAGLDSVRLASATQSAAAFLNSAVNRAERRQEALELVISPKENGMALYSNEPGFTREFHLPDGISLDAVLPAIPGEAEPRPPHPASARRGGSRHWHPAIQPSRLAPHRAARSHDRLSARGKRRSKVSPRRRIHAARDDGGFHHHGHRRGGPHVQPFRRRAQRGAPARLRPRGPVGPPAHE